MPTSTMCCQRPGSMLTCTPASRPANAAQVLASPRRVMAYLRMIMLLLSVGNEKSALAGASALERNADRLARSEAEGSAELAEPQGHGRDQAGHAEDGAAGGGEDHHLEPGHAMRGVAEHGEDAGVALGADGLVHADASLDRRVIVAPIRELRTHGDHAKRSSSSRDAAADTCTSKSASFRCAPMTAYRPSAAACWISAAV